MKNTAKKRQCCFMPDQTDTTSRCDNLAKYEIWYGDEPTHDDYSDACAAHLEELLDDHNRFEILRIHE